MLWWDEFLKTCMETTSGIWIIFKCLRGLLSSKDCLAQNNHFQITFRAALSPPPLLHWWGRRRPPAPRSPSSLGLLSSCSGRGWNHPHLQDHLSCFAQVSAQLSPTRSPPPSPWPWPICVTSYLPMTPSSPKVRRTSPLPIYLYIFLCEPKHGISECRLTGPFLHPQLVSLPP